MKKQLTWQQALWLWRHQGRGMVENPNVGFWTVFWLVVKAAVEMGQYHLKRWLSKKVR